MSYRSEANYIGNKQNHKDLKMTQYPNAVDTRTNNINMRGFINLGETAGAPDYVMAEYTNALIDATMAIQRTLGETPMIYHGAEADESGELIENFTVADRLTRIEDGLFDVRYGGEGWRDTVDRPVLNKHRHTGVNGQPPQIDLTEEVSNKLPHQNIDLNYKTGLTGAHIPLSPNNPTKIADTLDDFLSKSNGGTVKGPVNFIGPLKTRTHIDATANDVLNRGQSDLIADPKATAGRALSTLDTDNQRRLFSIGSVEKEHLLYGRYVLGIRLKKSKSLTENINLLSVQLGEQTEHFSEDTIKDVYRTVHYVFEHNSDNKDEDIIITKLSTEESVEVRVDNYYITPIHPATLDR